MPNAAITLEADIKEMVFSRARCFRFDGGEEDRRCLSVLANHLAGMEGGLAFFGAGRLARYLLEQSSILRERVSVIVDDDSKGVAGNFAGIPAMRPESLPATVNAVFLCEARWRVLDRMRKALPANVRKVTLDDLKEVDWRAIPSRAWVPAVKSIYPIDIPEIEFLQGQDVILLDFPARSIAQLPVGFGYVHMALKREGIRLQTVDLDTIIYHRFHSDRILDAIPVMRTPAGRRMPEDPWQPVHYLEWEKGDLVDYFQPDVDEIVSKLVRAHPRILACSLQQANLTFARRIVQGVRSRLPDLVVIVGGMSCLQPGVAQFIFPLADYTVVGEADLTVGPLVKAILRGEKPRDLPGVWSRGDAPDREFQPGPIATELDPLGHPRYEWTDPRLYRNWNGYWLVPIVGSRGCPWSRCRFCAERFHWRTRTPEKVVDDIEYFHKMGAVEFVFNESDLHGDTLLIERLCDEIIRRGLSVHMTAQLRCNKRAGKEYYRKLAKAGFVCLRFGVDGWSANAMKLQRKGYSKEIVRDNLRYASEAGITTEVNAVVGVPGETEADVDEAIEFFKELKPYIGRVPFVNPLMLFRGSDYWNRPEEFGIKFRAPQKELYARYPVAIPDAEWYSESPYIDAAVRYQRLKRIVRALHENGIPTTAWTEFTAQEVGRKDADLASTHNAAFSREQEKPAPAPAAGGEPVAPASDQPERLPPYRGYNLVHYRGLYYGAPVAFGRIDFTSAADRMEPWMIVGESRDQLTRTIDGVVGLAEDGEPYLICRVGDSVLGIPSAAGAVTVQVVKALPHYEGSSPPTLIGSYKGFNLVAYGRCVLTVPLSLGVLDLTRKADRERPGILIASTDTEARAMIDKAVIQESSTPTLIGSYKGYNLVAYARCVFAVPLSLGALHLGRKADRERPGILVAPTDTEARAMVDSTVGRG